ncbi:XRE family transcriptional regulator [Sphingomonas hylomeconis]|uniref:XRE family transcriptional regulator n=1 Tax=Sphingomonas hylomeconis TaxID=1395958 RepID=A0ABV7SVS9_9SPHN|nr:S24 family peptidase [Sphingomonas hylomeconis]
MNKAANILCYGEAMNSPAERLRDAMAARGIDQPALAAAVGCTQGAISQILTGATQRSRFLPDIAMHLHVPLVWLKGDGQDAVPEADALNFSDEAMADQLELVPIASVDQAYGMGATFADDGALVDVQYFPKVWIEQLTHTAPVSLTWARGKGDSMAPTINDNDMVLIDRSERRVEDQDLIWAFTIGDIAMIKRLRIRGDKVTILSDNSDVSDDTAHPDEINIIGRITRVVKPV